MPTIKITAVKRCDVNLFYSSNKESAGLVKITRDNLHERSTIYIYLLNSSQLFRRWCLLSTCSYISRVSPAHLKFKAATKLRWKLQKNESDSRRQKLTIGESCRGMCTCCIDIQFSSLSLYLRYCGTFIVFFSLTSPGQRLASPGGGEVGEF